MTTPSQYRAHADKYAELIKGTDKPDKIREFKSLKHTFNELAKNEDWMVNNSNKTVHSEEATNTVPLAEGEGPARTLTEEEERILKCLGASVIMQWTTLPMKLQRELFDNASSVVELLETGAFKQQMARFLHKHKDDEAGMKIRGNLIVETACRGWSRRPWRHLVHADPCEDLRTIDPKELRARL